MWFRGCRSSSQPDAHCRLGLLSFIWFAWADIMAFYRSLLRVNGQDCFKGRAYTEYKQAKCNLTIKRNHDHRHQAHITKTEAGDFILERKSLQESKAVFEEPHLLVRTETQRGVSKTIYYRGSCNVVKAGTVRYIVPSYTRRADDNSRGL